MSKTARHVVLDSGIIRESLVIEGANPWAEYFQMMESPGRAAYVESLPGILSFAEHLESVEVWLALVSEGIDRSERTAFQLVEHDRRVAHELLERLRTRLPATRNKGTEAALFLAYELGKVSQRAAMRVGEPPARHGRKRLVPWRGRWIDARPQEKKILSFIGDGDDYDLQDFMHACWGRGTDKHDRSKIDKALSKLNAKLEPRPALRIRGDRLIVE